MDLICKIRFNSVYGGAVIDISPVLKDDPDGDFLMAGINDGFRFVDEDISLMLIVKTTLFNVHRT